MFTKLRTVIYHVPRLDEAKAWYEMITGITPYFEEPFYIGFNVNGFELGLDPDMSNVEKGNQSVAYWSVENIELAVSRLVEAGALLKDAVQDVGGGIKVAVVNDPFGNAIGLIQEEAAQH